MAAQPQGNKTFFYFLKDTEIESDVNLLDDQTRQSLVFVINNNFSLDELRVYLDSNHELREEQKKLLFKFWKAHAKAIMTLMQSPVSNNT